MGEKIFTNKKYIEQMISVCMATYNGENYIKEQIVSILNQLSSEDELIISDDNSTDKTIEIIKRINDNRIKILFHNQDKNLSKLPNHYKVTKNFENALKTAKGDFIFLADQDDIWIENKVLECLHFLNDYDLVMTNCTLLNYNGLISDKPYRKTDPFNLNLINLIIKMPFKGCCLAFKKDILDIALPFPNNLIAHDNWIGFIAFTTGKTFFISEPLMLYRRHDSNVTDISKKSNNSFLFKINYRLIFILQLIKRIGIKKFLNKTMTLKRKTQ